jgi:DNA-binding NarL/FixJ family response regulator
MNHLVVIIEDDLGLARLMQSVINQIPGFHCERLFNNPVDFLDGEFPVDIVLLDVSMPEMSGLDAIEPILKKYPEASIVMNTVRDDDETIFEALKKGAEGYVVKHDPAVSLQEVLLTISAGGAFMTPVIAKKVLDNFKTKKSSALETLTDREQKIAEDIVEGWSYRLIAENTGVSINTVRKYIKRIYRKLNINSKAELFKLSKR